MNRLLLSVLVLAVGFRLVGQMTPAQSPAEKKISQAELTIQKHPKLAYTYSELARAFLERSRETGNPSFLQQASRTLEKAFAIEKDNFEGQRVMAGILLARHEYARALDLAKALHKRNMDDLIVWGEIADADIALGDYADAEKATQWMLDLRPGEVGSLERGARMRELVGNIEGAPQLWTLAFQAAGDRDTEHRAFLLVGYGAFYLSTGKLDQADKLLTQSLQTFPWYHLALSGLAKVRIAQRRYTDAVELMRKQAYPGLSDKYLLAQALDGSGQRDEAAQAYAAFEREAGAAADSPDNANRELVFYYTDHAKKPAEAVRVARVEATRRQDIGTLDALAWALHLNGDEKEARKQMDKVLAVGTHDLAILAHAQEIGLKLNSKQ